MHPKVRQFFSRAGSLLLLFQKSPIVQMILPEARVMGTTGVAELVKWTVASVAGLGVYDTVAGATTMTQIAPTPVVTPLNATGGTSMSLTAQVTGAPGNPGSWSISAGSLPPGITKTSSGSTCTMSGIPTTAGTFNFTLKAWENSGNSGGSITKAFSISVAAVIPVITTNPASSTINSGGTATLSAVASGTSPTFQWYIGTAGSTTSPISGATSASYTTPALSATTTYWVRATNSAGSDNSTAATVTVRIPPAFTNHPASATINSGTTKTLTVAASGSPAPTFQWYLGNSGVTTSPIFGATSASYTPPALTANSSYWVKATNAASSANSNTATLTVITPPAINSHPASVTINSGSTTTLTVAASGTAPTFQWFLGNSGDLSNPVQGATSASFTTPQLTVTTAYWAKAGNAAGTAVSTTATVTVIVPPQVSTQPAPASINSGGTTTLTVAASGTSPTFQWYVGTAGDTSSAVLDATAASFTTPPLTTDTRYWVRATNAAGTADSNAVLVTVASSVLTFEDWKNLQFNSTQLADPTISGPTADPDGDGISNEKEYVFGLMPLTAELPPTAAIVAGTGQFSVSFTAKAASGPGYTGKTRHYALETTDNLVSGTWKSPAGYEDIIAKDQNVIYNDTQAGPTRFYQLRIRLTP